VCAFNVVVKESERDDIRGITYYSVVPNYRSSTAVYDIERESRIGETSVVDMSAFSAARNTAMSIFDDAGIPDNQDVIRAIDSLLKNRGCISEGDFDSIFNVLKRVSSARSNLKINIEVVK